MPTPGAPLFADVDAFDQRVGWRLSGRTRNLLVRNLRRAREEVDFTALLRHTPDAALLLWRGVGPATLAELRRVLPYRERAPASRHPWWLVD